MRGRCIAVIMFLLLGSSALAQTPTTNRIGLFFDLDYWFYCQPPGPLGTTTTMYIVLVEPDFANLYGWEAALISADGRTFVLDSEIMGGGENLGRGNEFQVTYPDPMPTTSRTVLCSMSVLPLTYEECLYLTGVSHPSLADPRPLVWPTPAGPIPLDTYAPYENGVMAAISDCSWTPEHPYTPCSAVVGTQQQSWGTLKSTYR